jgi:predicted peptidase
MAEMIVKKFESKKHYGEYLDYLFSEPAGNEKLPLVFYIHGAGSRGNDIELLKSNSGLIPSMNNIEGKCIVAAPQCHCDTWFELFDVLLEFIDEILHGGRVDENRVYMCGPSMGGYTTWQVAMSRPDWFAAIVPICGGGMYWNAGKLKNIPVWAFHGALDATVLPEETIHMVKAVNNAGGNAKITIFANAAHDAWTQALSSSDTWNWVFSQRKTE